MKKIISYFKRLSETQFLILFLGTVLIYTIVIGIQGFDMVDEGWVLTAYQQLFEHPLSAEYQFLYYNTILIGAIWNTLFGSLGIIGFRVFSAICTTLIALIVFKILEKSINRWAIFLGIMMILFSHHYIMVFHHNLFTALICCLSSLCLYKSLIKRNCLLVILAGILVGINFFSRIPNASMLSLSLVFIPFALYTKDVRKTLKMFSSAISGVCIGVFINYCIMNILGHWDIFMQNISSGMSAASANDSTHSISNLFSVYASNYMTVFKDIAILFLCPAIAYFGNKWSQNKTLSKIILILSICIHIILVWNFADGPFTLYAFTYVISAIYALCHPDRENDIYLISIAAIIMFFLPFGSDYGIGNMGPSCVWIGFPLAIGLLCKLIAESKGYKDTLRIVIAMSFAFFVTQSSHDIYSTSLGCYFDGGSRLKKTATVNHPLANTYTNQYKCDVVNEMLYHLNQYAQENDYLLCWQCVPMVHYLTHTYPYLNTSWPWVYDSGNLNKQFNRAKESTKHLPVVLCNKSSIASWFNYNSDWDNENAPDQWNFNSEKIRTFHKFISDNNYVIAWENNYFQIMIPIYNTEHPF